MHLTSNAHNEMSKLANFAFLTIFSKLHLNTIIVVINEQQPSRNRKCAECVKSSAILLSSWKNGERKRGRLWQEEKKHIIVIITIIILSKSYTSSLVDYKGLHYFVKLIFCWSASLFYISMKSLSNIVWGLRARPGGTFSHM